MACAFGPDAQLCGVTRVGTSAVLAHKVVLNPLHQRVFGKPLALPDNHEWRTFTLRAEPAERLDLNRQCFGRLTRGEKPRHDSCCCVVQRCSFSRCPRGGGRTGLYHKPTGLSDTLPASICTYERNQLPCGAWRKPAAADTHGSPGAL